MTSDLLVSEVPPKSQHRLALESSVQTYWRHHFTADVTTIFPGMAVDTSQFTSWAELWIQSSRQRRGRVTSLPMLDVAVVVHLFSRVRQNPGDLRSLIDQACELLTQRTLLIRDFAHQGMPIVGYLKLYEARAQLMVEGEASSRQPGLSHAVVTCEGLFGGLGGE